jgi:hypothetical protein
MNIINTIIFANKLIQVVNTSVQYAKLAYHEDNYEYIYVEHEFLAWRTLQTRPHLPAFPM